MADGREYAEALTLLKHHLGIAVDLLEELTEAGPPDNAAPATPSPPAANGTPPSIPASKRDQPLVEQVLDIGSMAISTAAVRIMAAVAEWSGVGEAIPERPRDGKPPNYVRFAKGRKTFVYIQVRRDHLRIDLPINAADARELQGEVRVREVKYENPWKVSLYVKKTDDVQDAIDGIRYAYEVLFDEEPVVAE